MEITDNAPIIEEVVDSSDEDEDMQKLYNAISNIPTGNREYNILLLGETGAGKSTTINAVANYLKHFTFEKAVANDFLEIIPSKFTASYSSSVVNRGLMSFSFFGSFRILLQASPL